MKTHNIILIALFTFTLSGAFGQENVQRPVSKEIWKVSHKFLFTGNPVTVATVNNYSLVLTKEVQFVSNQIVKLPMARNMVSAGYPAWIISKPVNAVSPSKILLPAPATPLVRK